MEKLGVELPLLLTQIVNFTIVLLVLTKLLYKPILKGLEARRKKIEEGLAFAEKAKQEEEKLKLKKEEVLKEARDEVRVIMENAKKEAKHLKDEILLEGKKEVDVLKVRMEKELKSKYEETTRQLQGKTVDIAAEMVKKILPDILDNEKQHGLIIKQLKKLESHHAKS